VDEEGKLVGCLAAADLKQISESYDFTTLLKPVKDFLTDEVSKRQNMLFSCFLLFLVFLLLTFFQAPEPVVLHAFDTLADAVSKMVSHHVHRVFIVGPGGYPQG